MATRVEPEPAGSRARAPGRLRPLHRARGTRRTAGLPTSGAVALALGSACGGALADVLTGGDLRTAFAVCFVVGCVLAAVFVRRSGLRAAVILPPLVYVTVAFGAGAIGGGASMGSWLAGESLDLVTALMTGAPVLLAATALAAVVALVRLAAFRGAPPPLPLLSRG